MSTSRRSNRASRDPAEDTAGRGRTQRRLLRPWQRVIDGAHPWGELETWSTRYGFSGYRLIVYPPGTTAKEGSRYWLLRNWPQIGLLLGLIAVFVASPLEPFGVAMAVGAVVYGAGAVALCRAAGPNRKLVRTLQASRDIDAPKLGDPRLQRDLRRFAVTLIYSEMRLRRGELGAVQFQAVWGEVWRELGDPRFSPGRGHREL